MIEIRPAAEGDADAVWRMIRQVAREGDSFPFSAEVERGESLARWLAPEKATFVGLLDGAAVGTYYVRANHGGRGGHVANAGYIVRRDRRRRGVGAAMVEHSLETARELGFLAMQFNLVVSTNEAAIGLYRRFGFRIVGTLPKAFRHPTRGLVDAHVMHRFL